MNSTCCRGTCPSVALNYVLVNWGCQLHILQIQEDSNMANFLAKQYIQTTQAKEMVKKLFSF
jgi:hypothetical protein